jgi:hypothetical protein
MKWFLGNYTGRFNRRGGWGNKRRPNFPRRDYRHLRDRRACAQLLRERGNRRGDEKRADRNCHLEPPANAVDGLNGFDRVATQGKEVVVDSDGLNVQNLLPYFRQAPLMEISRRDEFLAQTIRVELRQRAALDLQWSWPESSRQSRVPGTLTPTRRRRHISARPTLDHCPAAIPQPPRHPLPMSGAAPERLRRPQRRMLRQRLTTSAGEIFSTAVDCLFQPAGDVKISVAIQIAAIAVRSQPSQNASPLALGSCRQ